MRQFRICFDFIKETLKNCVPHPAMLHVQIECR